MASSKLKLKRVISLPMLILYGVGNMVGAGFYALLGKVVGISGFQAPLAFLISGFIAFLTAFSFSEFCSRYPVCSGPSRYVKEAFGSQSISCLVGYLVIATGVISAATIFTAFNQFLQEIVTIPSELVITSVVFVLTAVAIRGIKESVFFSGVITVITIWGLLYVLFCTFGNVMQSPEQVNKIFSCSGFNQLQSISSGVFLCFYAFIGFEDLVCNAEEINDVEKNIPRGILLSLTITLIFYFLVSVSAVISVEPDVLAVSPAPLALLVEGNSIGPVFIILVGLIAGINGALTQIIMASRMLYGMALEGNVMEMFGVVHPVTQTPMRATLVVSAVVLSLSLFVPLVTLAQFTSFIILLVFAAVNLALCWLKKNKPLPVVQGPCYPIFIPFIGFLCCFMLLILQSANQFVGLISKFLK